MELPAEIPVQWPVGPYVPGGTEAWVRYKLASAQWYIDTLERLGAQFDYGRLLGVEMALDGAIAALCGAVDAVQIPLFDEVWATDGRQPKQDGTHPKLRDFRPRLGDRPEPLGAAGRALAQALLWPPDATAPVGWLGKLRHLRNRAVHQETLPRYISAVIGGADEGVTTGLSVPGEMDRVEPVTYLRQTHQEVDALVETLLKALGSPGPPPHDQRSARINAVVARVIGQAPGPSVGPS